MRQPSVLQGNPSRRIVAAMIVVAGTLACAAEADARGGGGAPPPGPGVAPRPPRQPRDGARWGNPQGPHNRFATRGRRAYNPSAGGWGYGGFVAGEAGAPTAFVEPSTRTEFLYSQSVIIHRGPAFGEPGYYSHPSIQRIIPEPSKRAGVRRYRVERTDF